MKTTKNIALFSLTALVLAGPVVAATTNTTNSTNSTKSGSAAAACTGTCTQKAAPGDAGSTDSTGAAAAPAGNGVSVSVGQDGVKVSMKGGFSFGKSLLGKVLKQGS